MNPLKHIPDIIHRFSEKAPNPKAFAYYKNDRWEYVSSEDFIDYVQCAALGLRAIGLQKGDCVGLLAKSSPYWLIADFAITIAGGVTVPFFSNLSEEHFIYEVGAARPRFIFLGDDESYEKAGPHCNLFEGVIKLEEDAEFKCEFTLWDLIRKGQKLKEEQPKLYEELEKGIDPDDLATIIFTSGSTGKPKGVELTHKNLVSIVHYEEFEWQPDERFLNVLPVPHIFAKQINYIMVAWGIECYYLNDLKKVGDICKEIHPTFMIVVPRLMEKIYSKMMLKVREEGYFKRAFGFFAFDLAAREEGLYKWLLHPIADKLVYSHLREALGGKLRLVISGGAALSPELHHFFLDIGIPIVQGWGLTEASTIAVNRWGKQKIGTCGPPMPSIQFKISEKGEVLVKGPTVMKGYYNNPEETARVIDKDGWLHTGDIGSLDEDGYLIIEGRLNESFKTAQGEFVIPGPIEQKLSQAPLIEFAMVIGEGQPFASCLLFPNKKVLRNLKDLHDKQDLSDEEFIKSRFVVSEMENLLQNVNATLDQWEQIHDYRFILEMPSIENGEMTPTMKLRRKKILEKYHNVVAGIYSQEAA